MVCVRTQMRSHAELRSTAVQSTRASRSRPWQLSAVNRVLRVQPRITGEFEHKPLSSMSINRSLGHLVEIAFLWAIFREHFATVGHALPILFVNTYSKVYFMQSFIFISLYYLMGASPLAYISCFYIKCFYFLSFTFPYSSFNFHDK
jgi:hypothetical protein